MNVLRNKLKHTMLVLTAVWLLLPQSTYAQTIGKLQGKITDQDGQPLPGAGIKAIGTKYQASSNNNGDYTLNLPVGTYEIEVSYISFQSRIFKNQVVVATKPVILNVSLNQQPKELNEVVVTALGISRDEKALGYASSTISGQNLGETLSDNWLEALSGKVAGLNIASTNAGPGSSASVILRGESNLTGSNEALIVVDGIVINNGSGRLNATTDVAAGGDESPIDYGSSLNDLNPEDIESVTVLKGPGAAALYGQRGANGAIIITTKSGKPRVKGIGVSWNSNSAFQFVTKGPDYQYEYGQGADGRKYYAYTSDPENGWASTRATSSAYGPRFEGQYFYQYDPVTQKQGTERTLWRPYENAHQDFFDVGKTFTNSITLDGGTRNTPIRFSVTNVNNNWIVPNTGASRNTISFSASHQVNEKFKISTKVNYQYRWSDNLPASGYTNQTIMYWSMYWVPNADINWIRNYWRIGQEGIQQNKPFSSGPENPFAIAYEMLNKLKRNALTGNIQLSYDFTPNLNLTVRTSVDLSNQETSQQRPFGTSKFPQGMYRTQDMFSQELSSDFLLKYNKKFGRNIKTSFTFGGSQLANRYSKNEVRANNLLYPELYNFANSRDALTTLPYRSQYAINSFYGMSTFAYKDYLFLDVTARNDWNSVLATATSTDNVSFFYPSVNLSTIVSEVAKLPSFVNYAKVRASYASVGSGRTTPYLTSLSYIMATGFPGGLSNPRVYNNTNLKPLRTISYEIGTDLRMFKNRWGLDLTLYNSYTRDQILSSVVDRSIGVDAVLVNAGEVQNRGIEIETNYQILRSKRGLGWKATGTFSANDNKVTALAEGLNSQVVYAGVRGSVEAHLGQRMDAIYGIGYQRSPSGEIIYENGYAKQTSEPIYLGNTTPKWKASIGNEFTYKQFRLNFLFDGQYGAVAYSFTNAVNTEQGKVKSTLPGRENGIIGKGVIKNADGTYRPNDVVADNIANYYLYHAGRDNVEGNIFSTDFIKLREARFDYTLSKKMLAKLKLQKATIGVYGRNLWIYSKWPIYDPEFGTLTYGEINKGFETAQFPSSRVFGINLNIGI